MIKGMHGLFYSSDAAATREFLRDKLDLPAADVGGGWLIFDFAEADLGCHPTDTADGAVAGTHNISFYCDDINETVRELKGRGVEFVDEISDQGYGLVTHFQMPGGLRIQLYEPKYQK